MSGETMLRIDQVMQRSALSRSSVYLQIKQGTFPSGVKIGNRSAAWPESDIDAVIAARVAGWSSGRIQNLVSELHRARGQS